MDMPRLQPIPIDTKSRSFFVRVWRWLTSIRQWEVIEPFHFELPDGTVAVIPKGFRFDGASIPRPLWALLSPTGLLLIPGLIHDFGYRYDYIWVEDANDQVSKRFIHKGQKFWDQLFRQIGIQVNGLAIMDTIAYIMLRLFGWMAWNKNRRDHAPDLPLGGLGLHG